MIVKVLKDLYEVEVSEADITVSRTKPEFTGDYTLVLFTLVKSLRKSPEQLGQEIGRELTNRNPHLFTDFNVIKGFLNLSVADQYWIDFLRNTYANKERTRKKPSGQTVVVEYSSPNTNKPLHLGHLRNNFLGWSVAAILENSGYHVVKTAILNDRGIHICKSMVAWQRFADGATPDSTGIKGDHFVGDYYVRFGVEMKKEARIILDAIETGAEQLNIFSEEELKKINLLRVKRNELRDQLTATGDKDPAPTEPEGKKAAQAAAKKRLATENKIAEIDDELKDMAENKTELMQAAQTMLRDWEKGDQQVRELWQKMNGWVYDGFNETYKKIGSDFDKNYFESETYLLGKEFVEEGLKKGVFYRKDDGSVWIDLTADGLDEKLVLRKDGTSVYITQDLGLAEKKFEEFKYDQSIYVIADEQNYHMKVLKLILQKLGKPYADGIYHLSYGLVELPSGRMKTREGTVVDADDLIEELKKVARDKTEELGKVKDFNPGELNELYDTIALGALKFFLLRVDPKKKMVFNPEESIDIHGFTGPFVQYTHARIKSILRKETAAAGVATAAALLPKERELIVLLEQFEAMTGQAAAEHDPSLLANYAFTVAKTYNTFYTEHSVMNAETPEKKQLRLQLCELTAGTIAAAMALLGIRVPERM